MLYLITGKSDEYENIRLKKYTNSLSAFNWVRRWTLLIVYLCVNGFWNWVSLWARSLISISFKEKMFCFNSIIIQNQLII